MSTPSSPFTNLPELLRQAQLMKNLQTIPQVSNQPTLTVPPPKFPSASQIAAGPTPQGSGQIPQAPQTSPPINPAPQAGPATLGAPPQTGDYKPSLGRRILAAVAGGLTGINNPALGAQTAKDIDYSPYNKAMTDYQARVQAMQTGQEFGTKSAQQQAEVARAGAENARAQQEEAHRKQIEYEVEHPTVKTGQMQLYNIKKQDGTTTLGMMDPVTKGLIDVTSGERIPGSDIAGSDIYKPGTEKTPTTKLDVGTGNLITPGTGGKPATVEHVEEPKENPNSPQEWDRRNKVQFDQKMQMTRVSLKDSIQKLEQSAQIRESQPAAQSKATAEFAKTVDAQVPALLDNVKNIADKIGPGAGRWNNLWVNKAGLNDPEFAGLDQDLTLFATALVRVHFGMRGGQTLIAALHKNFSEAQSPQDLESRIQHADTWIKGYANMNNIKPIDSNSSGGGGTLPGGITLDDINKELDRRKK